MSEKLLSLLPEDLNYIVSAIPKMVRELMKSNQLYLGGGFIRSMITGEKASDIDLFIPNEPTYLLNSLISEFMDEHGDNYKIKTKYAVTIVRRHLTPIQIITRWKYDDPVYLFNDFDFTIAQAVIWYYGNTWLSAVSNYFYADLAAKRLRYTKPTREEDAGGSILRVMKFLRRGYKISPEALSDVIVQFLKGVGGDRSMDRPDLSRIISGLMREVDPLRIDENNNVLLPDDNLTEIDDEDSSKNDLDDLLKEVRDGN